MAQFEFTPGTVPAVVVRSAVADNPAYQEVVKAVQHVKANRAVSLTVVLPTDPKKPETATIDRKTNPAFKELEQWLNKAGAAEGVTIKKSVNKVLSADGKKQTGVSVQFWAVDKVTRPRGVTVPVVASGEVVSDDGSMDDMDDADNTADSATDSTTDK